MFGWFKKKPSARANVIPDVIKQMMEPMALATALAETISEYFKAVEKGKVSSPAYQRKGDSVVGIWTDTRLEALRHLWGYGASDAMLLADHRQQTRLLNAFFEKKPQLEYPRHPSHEPIHDTLQAVFQVYLFLNNAGSVVGDKETDRLTLKLVNKTIFDDFEQQAKVLWSQWIDFEQAVHGSSALPSMPATLLEVLYKDVTKKAKTIALSGQFGPNYQSGINYLVEVARDQLRKQGESEESIDKQVQQILSTTQKVLEAHDPDHLA
jgi:hypothetical protein